MNNKNKFEWINGEGGRGREGNKWMGMNGGWDGNSNPRKWQANQARRQPTTPYKRTPSWLYGELYIHCVNVASKRIIYLSAALARLLLQSQLPLSFHYWIGPLIFVVTNLSESHQKSMKNSSKADPTESSAGKTGRNYSEIFNSWE